MSGSRRLVVLGALVFPACGSGDVAGEDAAGGDSGETDVQNTTEFGDREFGLIPRTRYDLDDVHAEVDGVVDQLTGSEATGRRTTVGGFVASSTTISTSTCRRTARPTHVPVRRTGRNT